MIRNKIYLIPNLLTTGSVLCGFLSIIYSFDNNIQIAANLIFASFVLDGLDEACLHHHSWHWQDQNEFR